MSAVDALKTLDGFVATAMVDSSSGMMLDSVVVGNFPIEVAAACNTEVVQAKNKAMEAIDLGDDSIEDILISLGTQYHLIRPLGYNRDIFIYLALERSRANLALARLTLKKVETSIKSL